jgi:hypothetical protein
VPVTNGSDGQARFRRPFEKNGIGRYQRVRSQYTCHHANLRDRMAIDCAGEHAVQVLQRMVLVGSIGVAGLVVILGYRAAGVGIEHDEHAMIAGDVRRVTAQERSNPENLGDQIQSEEPRTESTRSAHRRHSGLKAMTT